MLFSIMEKHSLYSIKRSYSTKSPATNKFFKKDSTTGVFSVTFAKCFGPDICRIFVNY